AAFLGLILYFGYFLQITSEEVINNSYNARLDRFSDRIVRGNIVSSDGQVLAETHIGDNGDEIRVYPFGTLFAHVVGHSTKGKTGLESLGNFYLLTSHVNLLEQVINEISDQKNPGDDVVTSLDVGLQQVAYQALGDRKGAVVAM
ncbi:MAG: penicillin-binding protein 2, partial [Lachnospiraceae bacterium]|nr:penicillin-binding protein 2 [Lachnospiraceae bacterium]